MKCPKCGGEMSWVCDPKTKKCYWYCNSCGNRKGEFEKLNDRIKAELAKNLLKTLIDCLNSKGGNKNEI